MKIEKADFSRNRKPYASGVVTGWWTFKPGKFAAFCRFIWNLTGRPRGLYSFGFVYEPATGSVRVYDPKDTQCVIVKD